MLFRLSRDIATQAPDGQTAFQAIDEMDKCFQIDASEMKLAVLTKFTLMARLPEHHTAVAEKALAVLDEAIAKDKFTVAAQLADVALREAKKAKGKTLASLATKRAADLDKVSQAFEEVKRAAASLEKSPTDPEANLIVGKYKCFVKGEWETGIPMLARGNDANLKAPAAKESEPAASLDELAALGDKWWDLADTKTA